MCLSCCLWCVCSLIWLDSSCVAREPSWFPVWPAADWWGCYTCPSMWFWLYYLQSLCSFTEVYLTPLFVSFYKQKLAPWGLHAAKSKVFHLKKGSAGKGYKRQMNKTFGNIKTPNLPSSSCWGHKILEVSPLLQHFSRVEAYFIFIIDKILTSTFYVGFSACPFVSCTLGQMWTRAEIKCLQMLAESQSKSRIALRFDKEGSVST